MLEPFIPTTRLVRKNKQPPRHTCDSSEDTAALFEKAYQEHSGVLYAYLVRHTGGDDAADLLQEIFIRVWRHIDNFLLIPTERRRYWLLAIARNISTDYYRRRAVRRRHETPMPDDNFTVSRLGNPDSNLLSAEATLALDSAVENLPPTLRTVLSMHIEDGMTSAEIGKVLGRPAGTVRCQISKARQRVARELDLPWKSDG